MHDRHMLFAQLGLPDDDRAIERFIQTHSPMPPDMRLADAPFWEPSQASFLREGFLIDADWAVVIDALNREMHRARE